MTQNIDGMQHFGRTSDGQYDVYLPLDVYAAEMDGPTDERATPDDFAMDFNDKGEATLVPVPNETRDNIADALRDFGWTVASYGDASDHYAVHVREDDGDSETSSGYVLSLTREGMPAFESMEFDTLDALNSYVAERFPGAAWREDGE